MDRVYYRLLYRLHGSDRFLLWYSDDHDGVETVADGVPSFRTEADLRAFADARRLPVSGEEPVLHDLDLVAAWLADPRGETIRCGEFLAAWNLFGDVARSSPAAAAGFGAHDERLGGLYEKLFWGSNLPAVTPVGERFVPEWSRDEVADLRRVLQEGLDVLVRLRRDGDRTDLAAGGRRRARAFPSRGQTRAARGPSRGTAPRPATPASTRRGPTPPPRGAGS